MRTELDRMRQALRAALPEKAFLKRDRGDALFITNALIFDSSIPSIPGFILIPDGKLMQVLPDAGWIAEIEKHAEAPDHLSTSLLRFRSMKADMENLSLCAQGFKLLDMGPSAPAAEIEAFEHSLRSRAALALRGAASGGGLYAAAVINHKIKSMKENEI